MAEFKTLSAQKRENLGKGYNRRLRTQGLVPAVFYSRSGENIALQVSLKELNKIFEQVGRTTVFNIDIKGAGSYPVLFWDAMRDPCKNTFTHVDFYGVDLDRPVKVVVPLEFSGVARGTKVGGVLETYRERILLMAKPLDMPAKVVIDLSNMDINDTIQVADVQLPEGVQASYDVNYAIVSVLPPSSDSDAAAE